MTNEQERAEFEAFASQHGLCVTEDGDLYRSQLVAWMWKSWQARAALQSQDREDAERFRFCLEHGFPQKWAEMVKGNFRYYWTSRPGSQEEFSSAIEAIDHARRVEGDGE